MSKTPKPRSEANPLDEKATDKAADRLNAMESSEIVAGSPVDDVSLRPEPIPTRAICLKPCSVFVSLGVGNPKEEYTFCAQKEIDAFIQGIEASTGASEALDDD